MHLIQASTTGNVYGVYDMSGGSWEATSAWDASSEHEDLKYGSSFVTKDGSSTKYATAYRNGTETYYGIKIYEVGKIGDSTKEVWNSYPNLSQNNWFSDHGKFVRNEKPFFTRGANVGNDSSAGVFASDSWNGDGHLGSFRVTLCP